MKDLLDAYGKIVGKDVIEHLRQLADKIRGLKVVHVNSTKFGGGVAEILHALVPLMQALGLDARWEIITGDDAFFQCTKGFHNALQGDRVEIPADLLRTYEETNRRNSEGLKPILEDADIVFIHDPQPAPLLSMISNRRGKWIWRCHIDLSRPFQPVWKYLRQFLSNYDASIFSLASFARSLPHPQYLIPPSIDPLSEKNMGLEASAVQRSIFELGMEPNRPIILQVSRFDRFKDPVGVIQAYRLAKKYHPEIQLALVGGTATDDPEGQMVLDEVNRAAKGDSDIHVAVLPPDANTTINALQRGAGIILQKSVREGFGLTVTEALWKERPVIGGNVGGIRLQIVNNYTGFLVNTPEGAAIRIMYYLDHPQHVREMGHNAREFVRENFLITRQLREYLTVMVALIHGASERIELG